MRLPVISRVLGVLLMVFSFTMIPPMLISAHYHDGALLPFFYAFVAILGAGLCFWFPVHKRHDELQIRDGFLIVVLFWTVLGGAGAIPLLLEARLGLGVTDAFFESLSGLTTTGATVISGLDFLPKSILFYRQQLQWLGGMGIIVLAVAILPMLGIGGMQLYRAETPGPVKENKLTPRITETAKALWYIYVWLTIACAVAYFVAGMDLFDAVCHAFSTIAIGGFSTHDASIGYFNNPWIDAICVTFMLIAAINFALHFVSWRNHSLRGYLDDPECKFFFLLVLITCTITVMGLYFLNVYNGVEGALRYGIFEAVSILTTTGFATGGFAHWPSFLPLLLLIASFTGGCAGSTAGGVKVIRSLLILKQGLREVRRLIHPNAVMPIKLGKSAVPERVLSAVWGFVAAYLVSFIVLVLAVNASGLEFTVAFSAVAACINNLGPGLGEIANHYGNISDPAKWILCFAMLLGRLEIFTLLVLFIPMFWRK